MVVDDNDESRRLIGQVLQLAGATVVETASAASVGRRSASP